LLIASIPGSAAFAPARSGATASVLADLRDGAAALRRSRPVVVLIGAEIATSAVYGAQTVLLVLLARRFGGDGYGLLIGAIGAGGLAGAAIGGRVAGKSSSVLVVALLGVAAAMALLAASPSLPAAMLLAAAGGAGSIVVEIMSETGMQRHLDDAVLARAYGLALPAVLGGIVAGSLVAAPLQAAVGLDGAFIACGLAVALYAAVVAAATPAFHRALPATT
jgi:predicted MFS family arabinose efflux permease